MAAIEIKYTDLSIKNYTEVWAVKRLNKRAFVIKQSLIGSVMLLLSGLPTLFRQGIAWWNVAAMMIPAVVMTFLGSLYMYWSRERSYQKFLDYQAQRQAAEPNPGVYYN